MLSTKIAELQAKIENQSKQVTVFATQATKETTLNLGTGGKGGGTHCSKQDPYTVATWHLTKTKDKVSMNGKDYFWCTGNHCSGGTKHDGMYADHKTCDHNAWRARMDERCTPKNGNGTNGQTKPVVPSKPAEDSSQKLTFNDKLCNTYCAQAGLSAEAVD